MLRVEKNGLVWYTLASYTGLPVVHGAFTRLGGFSRTPFADLNVGGHVGDDSAAVAANHRAIYAALGVDPARVVSARQVHGDRVARVGAPDAGSTLDATDALITDTPGLLLLLRFADCVPVWLYDPRRRVVGLAHAGWQGTARCIAAKTVCAMGETFGSRPEDIRAGLGPAIGPCCYEVGSDVIEALRVAVTDVEGLLGDRSTGTAHLDLWEANAVQLRAVGVSHIEKADICTSCHVDAFYSHRREEGRTGRFAVVAGLDEA